MSNFTHVTDPVWVSRQGASSAGAAAGGEVRNGSKRDDEARIRRRPLLPQQPTSCEDPSHKRGLSRSSIPPSKKTADQLFDGDQLYTRVSVSPIKAARSLSDRRSVTRNASTPCSYVNNATARVQSVPHMQRLKPKASKMRKSGSHKSV